MKHFKKWLQWRKVNSNSKFDQFLVLFHFKSSPSFDGFTTSEEWINIVKAFDRAVENGREK